MVVVKYMQGIYNSSSIANFVHNLYIPSVAMLVGPTKTTIRETLFVFLKSARLLSAPMSL